MMMIMMLLPEANDQKGGWRGGRGRETYEKTTSVGKLSPGLIPDIVMGLSGSSEC